MGVVGQGVQEQVGQGGDAPDARPAAAGGGEDDPGGIDARVLCRLGHIGFRRFARLAFFSHSTLPSICFSSRIHSAKTSVVIFQLALKQQKTKAILRQTCLCARVGAAPIASVESVGKKQCGIAARCFGEGGRVRRHRARSTMM